MLFREAQHAAIAAGDITRTVRAWTRPQARIGARHVVWSVGEIEIDDVVQVTVDDLGDADARRSGFSNRAALIRDLERTAGRVMEPDEQVFRVDFHFVGPVTAPRLQEQDELSPEDVAEITEKLSRMDQRSKVGPWTRATLALIGRNPGTVSRELATVLDRDRMALKADIRKLKRLGLTESLEVGYRLSARGLAWMAVAGE